MENKQSFLLYADLINVVDLLDDQKAGALFKMILKFVNGKKCTTDDLVLNIAFEPIKLNLLRNDDKYLKKVKKIKENGIKGSLKRWHPNIYKMLQKGDITLTEAVKMAKLDVDTSFLLNDHGTAIACHSPQSSAIDIGSFNENVSDNENVNDNVSVSDKNIDEPPPSDHLKVEKFLLEKNIDEQVVKKEASKFFNYYEANGWQTRNGKMKNWKAGALNWIGRIPDFKPLNHSSATPPEFRDERLKKIKN